VVGGLSKKRKDGLCAVHCDNFFHKALIYGAKIVWFLKIIFQNVSTCQGRPNLNPTKKLVHDMTELQRSKNIVHKT
jgi:hypothetical protein